MTCLCGAPRRLHSYDGLCKTIGCLQFESADGESEGMGRASNVEIELATSGRRRPAAPDLPRPRVQAVPLGSMPTGDSL